MAELAEGDAAAGAELQADLASDLDALRADWNRMERQLLLAEPYDERPAIVSVHAGAGGTESQDWAEMLLRMYLRWAEGKRFRTEILDQTEGEEAGLKSVTFGVDGRWVYGLLRSERGVHRLVRISPFDSQKRRHTSFALVEVMPDVPADVSVEIDEKELRIDTYRSSGAGGQHVNKTDSAVRITHLPTGIVVAVQNERSQHQNRERAMAVLRARLVERQVEEREVERLRLRGEHVEAGWGNQIRSYVLQPYAMVKDLRTGVESSNPTAVLGGEIDPFIEGYLRAQVGRAADETGSATAQA
jgi:peptide chain release factor 2